MEEKRYKLRFLPLFEDDLNRAIDYIAFELENPEAAERLADSVQAAIRERLPYAEAFEAYPSTRERQYPYYRIYVKNYIVFCTAQNPAAASAPARTHTAPAPAAPPSARPLGRWL